MKHINLQSYSMLEIGFNMSFKHLRFPAATFFLLLFLHLHLLLALPPKPVLAGQDQNDKEAKEAAKPVSISTESGGEHVIRVVKKRGGGAAAGARGGGGGDTAASANGGGGDGGDNGRGSGAQIPVYTAGAMNHNRYHHHGSNGGAINCVGSSCLALIFITSVSLFYCTNI
ncbi:glycine-rich RNA-binding protein GRP1A-like [Hibiscus syriacus]|uniref:glycine-rich RNA-binding protein GRP1A-like n=1 Tax=Hibiscus syriacus TaxID=106335 RepID=UPI00192498E2|nr:glycine-rich RNA-binding protein GRP1A-like [Hibiscus syriacus]